MAGPIPKDPEIRQRVNKRSTHATLTPGTRRRVPKLPDTERLAVLVDAFWREPSVKVSAEIRQVGMAYGLSPIDRRRLEWSVERAEPKREAAPQRVMPEGEDPRRVLQVVS